MNVIPTEIPSTQPELKKTDVLLNPTKNLNNLAHQEQWNKGNNANRQAATALLSGATSVGKMLLTIDEKSHADPKLAELIETIVKDPKFDLLANQIERIDTDQSLSLQLVRLLKTINRIAK